MDSEKSLGIPNFFYDLIVFVSPSILIIVGILVGMMGWSANFVKSFPSSIGAINFLFFASIFLFFAYEYGRFAEAFSHTFVTRVITFLKDKKLTGVLFKSKDFNLDFENEIESLGLPINIRKDKKSNKWTIYFHALLYEPHIGQDLMKRYAWEKLSRSSAFTFLILFAFSLICLILRLFSIRPNLFQNYGFGSLVYTLCTFILTISTFYEFYKRKCWNNDLLIKVTPILLLAKELRTKNK